MEYTDPGWKFSFLSLIARVLCFLALHDSIVVSVLLSRITVVSGGFPGERKSEIRLKLKSFQYYVIQGTEKSHTFVSSNNDNVKRNGKDYGRTDFRQYQVADAEGDTGLLHDAVS